MNIQTEIKVKVLLFGNLAELVGKNECEISCKPSFSAFKNALLDEYPLLTDHTFVYAVNKKIIDSEISIDNYAEIALLPPFSGG